MSLPGLPALAMFDADARLIEIKNERETMAGDILRTWGAAVLRPYTSVRWLEPGQRLTAEILRYPQDDLKGTKIS